MALQSCTLLGPYEIIGQLGAGGMGEVYKARDTRLNRTVAIKVLPGHVTDTESRVRLEREARAISSLDHPHICALYDVGEHNGAPFIVMQYLEGQTLAERLARGPLPVDLVLRLGIEIAGALEHAHRAGIVHRDLKPANIMLTGSSARGAGAVKLLDFGLAKPQAVTGSMNVSDSTQLAASPVTAEGVILGTVRYMAPEQVEGKNSDARTDVFALGVVLHEMLTGTHPFDGPTPASVIGSILKDRPPSISDRQPQVPPALVHIVERCVAKDPDDRWQTVSDVKRELEWVQSRAAAEPSHGPLQTPVRGGVRPAWRAVAVALLVALLGVLAMMLSRLWTTEPAAVVRFEIFAPPDAPFAGVGASAPTTLLAVSPDGKYLAFVAGAPGAPPSLWIKAFDSTQPEKLSGTEGAAGPFWSPDSRSIGFFAQQKLMRVDIKGGSPHSLCDVAPDPRGGTWGRDDVIVFAPSSASGLEQVRATSGAPSPAVPLRDGQRSYRWPAFLPDGRHFVFWVRASTKGGIYLGSLDGEQPRLLLDEAPYNGIVTAASYLLTMRDGTLLAYPFDLKQLHVTGEPIRVAEGVSGSSMDYASFSASSAGVLAYSAGLGTVGRLEWFDRAGKQQGVAAEAGDYSNFRISPNGQYLAFSRVDPKVTTTDIWLLDIPHNIPTRFTSDPGTETSPVWSPDSTRVAYRSDRAGGNLPYVKPVNSAEDAPQVPITPFEAPFLTDWSADGRFIAYHGPLSTGTYGIGFIDLKDPSKPVPLTTSAFMQIEGSFSPDGHWLAYASDVTGRMEVYVQAFPKSDARPIPVSTGGGLEPHWRRDGRELFYLAPDSRMMRVEVTPGAVLQVGSPVPLFKANILVGPLPYRPGYDVTADGSRFVIRTPVESARAASINVVVNWLTDLGKK